MKITFSLLLLVIIIQGCATKPPKSLISADLETQADQLFAVGEYLLAAEKFQQLVEQHPDRSFFYQSKAVEAFLSAGGIYAARALLEDVEVSIPLEQFQKSILLAKISLLENDPVKAADLLNISPPKEVPNSISVDFYNVRIQAHESSNNLASAARDIFQLGSSLGEPDEIRDNVQRLWLTLNNIDTSLLKSLLLSSSSDFASWVELTIINQSMLFKPKLLLQSVSMWKEQYPNHPAIQSIEKNIISLSIKSLNRPDYIALCLPLSGQYKEISQAIRDGFLTAWFKSTDYQPIISIYDTNISDILHIYQTAVENGAEFVVGPLLQSNVVRLIKNGEISVNTLMLSQADHSILENSSTNLGSNNHKLTLFGISPADRAAQVADKGIIDGHRKALVITPNDNHGLILYDAFRERWESKGGVLVEHVHFPSDTSDYLTPVKLLLNINSSDHRSALLRRRLNRSIKSDSRIRRDADLIFMAARSDATKQIVPQFRFYQTDIPIYATSYNYLDVRDQVDNDMNGVIFLDAPWAIDSAAQSSAIQLAINDNWPTTYSALKYLYAWGVDAYNIIPYLKKLTSQNKIKYSGETGSLHMTDNRKIQRQLSWAKFVGGRPLLLDFQDTP